jgi:hypothetical protein
MPKKNPGRPQSVRNSENVVRVRLTLQESRRRSARRHSITLGTSGVRRMIHMDLFFPPLKIQMVQELLPHDLNMRRDLEMTETPQQFIPNLITSDEAHLNLSS